MKKFALVVFTALLSVSLQAQIQTPQPSPSSKLEQTVGLTNVVVEYSRPSMRGRTIFGDLVPYDALWRTGANKNTTVTFSDDVVVEGKELKAGTYAIFTRPGEAVWEVIFYSDSENWGTPQEWDASKVAATVKVEVYPMPVPIETYTMIIDDLHNNGGTLGILWEKVYVGVKFVVPTVAKATESIEAAMASPSNLTANDYFAAASYYFSEGMNVGKAKEWIDKAVSMGDGSAYWMMRVQSLIYAKLGDKKGAIEAAKKSLVAAQAAGNQDYVKMNKDSLKEWETE
ncbi:MAG: DUF2911 domain-containing protein [Flavobacteriaceae bacterium]|uniref:DUF2911 domain-containing protein n=1 Tax=Flagellimonas sp. SN16 TaxID=3415142 RepID=UPI003C3837B8|nr:DUF2911 domain-containing protein [Flavobacteriaceae bacterium]